MSQMTPLNSTTEGFLSSILNDEDLQLMDMMNDSMYPLRMVDGVATATPGGGAGLHSSSSSSGASSGLVAVQGATGCGSSADQERLDASSDSAVSSMGSERVASLSDGGEWMETSSDSEPYHLDCKYRAPGGHPHSHAPHEYTSGYRANGAAGGGGAGGGGAAGGAQKKHQMFGKQRYFQGEQQGTGGLPVGPAPPSMATPMPLKLDFGESSRPVAGALPQGAAAQAHPALPAAHPAAQHPGVVMNGSVAAGLAVPAVPSGASAFTSPMSMDDEEMRAHELKFGYYGQEYPRPHHARPPMEPVAHNHTYHLPPPPESSGAIQRPLQRDKPRSKDSRKGDDAHLTRDEKRARALNVPMAVDDIINLPMDEFNERLSKHDLSEAQLSLIRDIRRRGKNKVAAQNCRKRKLDQIVTLADEVQQMRSRKQKLLREHDYLTRETAHAKDKFSQLYRHVFSSLRDADGNPYSPYEYSLQQGPDGNVMVVPLSSSPSGGASVSTMESVHQQMSRSLAMAESASALHYPRGPMPQHQTDRQKDQQQHQQQQHPHGQHAPHHPHPHLPHQPHPHPHSHPHPHPHSHSHHPSPHPPHHPHSDPHRKE